MKDITEAEFLVINSFENPFYATLSYMQFLG